MPTVLLNLSDSVRDRVFVDDDFAHLAARATLTRFDPRTGDEATFRALLNEADAVLTCWSSRPVRPGDLAGRTRPLLIAHAAGSVRPVAAREILSSTIRLTQSANAMVDAVAQLSLAFVILGLRQCVARADALKQGRSFGGSYADLNGTRVGLVSLSRVGQATARLLQGLGAHVVGYDPYVPDTRFAELGVERAELDDLLRTCEAVSLHAPVTDETRNLVDARRVGLLPDGAALVNTARPAIVDQEAVFARAFAGTLTYYADVTEPEPLPVGHPAFACPHLFITPHIAGGSRQTLRLQATMAIGEIERWLDGRPLTQEVTAERYDLLA